MISRPVFEVTCGNFEWTTYLVVFPCQARITDVCKIRPGRRGGAERGSSQMEEKTWREFGILKPLD